MSDKPLHTALKLVSIVWKRCSIEGTPEFWKNPKIADGHSSTTVASFGVNAQRGIVRVELNTKMVGVNSGQPLELSGGFEAVFDFLLDELISPEGVVDPSTASTIIGIAYSTFRGMVLERTTGTLLGGAILSIINPYNLMPVLDDSGAKDGDLFSTEG